MSNYTLIPYDKFKALRAAADKMFTASEENGRLVLRTVAFEQRVRAEIDLIKKAEDGETLADAATLADYNATMAAHANAPLEEEEVRFDSPDYAKMWSWDTRWSGKYGENAPGAVRYVDGVGDVYAWYNASDERVAYLDTSVVPAIWKLDDGTEWCKYVPTNGAFVPTSENPVDPDGAWMQKDGQGNWTVEVTSSEWRIWPYDGYKLAVAQIKCDVQAAALLNGKLHYRFYTFLTAAMAQGMGLPAPGAGYYTGYYVVGGTPMLLTAAIAEQMGLPEPTGGYYDGVYKVRDWKYDTFRQFRRNANYDEPGGMIVYDYDKSKRPIIDARFGQYVEIALDTNDRVTGSDYAKATAIAMKIRSF